jgi:endothelin-converting enzyme/putative endopeptidase
MARSLRWVVLLGVACGQQPAATAPAAAPATSWQLDRSTLAAHGDPCRDFYDYACGGFATIDHVAADRDQAEWATDRANAANDRAVQELLTGRDHADDPELARLRTFFASCMASGSDRSAEPTLSAWLARIDGIARRDDVMPVVRELQRYGIAALFSYSGEPDQTDRTRYRGEIDLGALGSRRMYADTGATADARRARYRAHIAKMFELAGVAHAQAERDAAAVLDLEGPLVLAIPVRSDEVTLTEHPMTPEALAAAAPHLAWPAFLAVAGHSTAGTINVTSPEFLRAADAAVATRSLDELRADLRWQLLRALGPALPRPLADEHYAFATLSGVTRRARSDECQLEMVKAMGVELSRQFAQRSIGRTPGDRAASIAGRVQAELARAVRGEPWLSPAARTATADKVAALVMKIGFPDRWPSTGAFPLAADTFLANVLAAREYEQQRSWRRVGTARTRDSWENMVYPNAAAGMAAARLTIANAFPDLLSNSIVFTAAFLRAPLFDADAPLEVRYGSFGATVGHELIHVMEEHEFDRNGELHDTWSAPDLAAHDAQHACVIEQASAYVAFGAAHLDGKQTYSENVADLSGTRLAYGAMAEALGPRLRERGADGFTRAQRFFIAYAQHWCSAERPEFARDNLRDDPHAPVSFRTNFPLANLPAFADAFGCPAGAPMVRAPRCEVW